VVSHPELIAIDMGRANDLDRHLARDRSKFAVTLNPLSSLASAARS
jgi:hypothetical protein